MKLLEAIKLVLGQDGAGPGERVTWEPVTAIVDRNGAMIRGIRVPCSGDFVPIAGQLVPVLWQSGVPKLVLGHRVRRAKFASIYTPRGAGIIEQLVIGNFDGAGDDVWYRNFQRFEKLNIAGQLGGNQAQEVKWGYNGKGFAVACSSGWWYVFTIERDPSTVENGWQPVLAWSGRPLVESSQILSILATSSHRYIDTYGLANESILNRWEDDRPGYAPQWFEISYAHSFGNELTGGGAASGSASRAFTLLQLLAGQTDGGSGEEGAQVLDWYLDGDRKLKFLIIVSWDHFTISSPDGSGSRSILHWVSGNNETDGYQYTTEEEIESAGASCTVGAIKQDLSTVPEQHFFIYNATDNVVELSTFPSDPEIGSEETETSWGGRIDHIHTENQDAPPGSPVRSVTEYYYSGASEGGTQYDAYKDVALPPGGTFLIGNPTAQLFRDDLAFIPGPFKSTVIVPGDTTQASLMSRGIFHWAVTANAGADVRLWHYTVQAVTAFQANDEPRLFVVMERYPFVSGTAYINDIPEIGIFVVNPKTGALVRTIRAFQYCLAGAGLLAGNAHRIIWTLSAPWYSPTTTLHVTNLLTGEERSFTAAQAEALLGMRSFILSPDFAWNYDDPKQFYLPDQLPALATDDVLADVAGLLEQDLAVPGSIRAANDQDVLEPIGRYLEE